MSNHYHEAEDLLKEYHGMSVGVQVVNGLRLLLEAQVCATLALVDATRRGDSKNVRYAAIGANQGQ